MKLIIQIPCYNEAGTLPSVLANTPRAIEGIDRIETLVIDDGSRDGTTQVARAHGVDYVVTLTRNRGLAHAFTAGLEACLKAGADIIVNTDADNQYECADIPALVAPLIRSEADIVIGDRGVSNSRHFSPAKRLMQRIGSRVVQLASGLVIPDAASGFRAYTREAALRTLVLTEYSYTLETLIQAGARRMAVVFVPVRTNSQSRPSRLMGSPLDYVLHSAVSITRAFIMYRPLRILMPVAAGLFFSGLALGLRFVWFYLHGRGAGHVQSVVLTAILLLTGCQVLLFALLADLMAFNRKIAEETLYKVRRLELGRQG